MPNDKTKHQDKRQNYVIENLRIASNMFQGYETHGMIDSFISKEPRDMTFIDSKPKFYTLIAFTYVSLLSSIISSSAIFMGIIERDLWFTLGSLSVAAIFALLYTMLNSIIGHGLWLLETDYTFENLYEEKERLLELISNLSNRIRVLENMNGAS